MKKLTKRVKVEDLYIDVPVNSEWVVASPDTGVLISSEQSVSPIPGENNWLFANPFRVNLLQVDLSGKNWRECCWYVGDQVDGEGAERREWMARGVDSFGEYHNFSDKQFAQNAAKKFADKIRSGEIDL